MAQSKTIINSQSGLLNGPYATEIEIAEFLGVEVFTLRTWASRRKGPGGRVKVGKKIYYRREAVLEWLASKETDPDQSLKRDVGGAARPSFSPSRPTGPSAQTTNS